MYKAPCKDCTSRHTLCHSTCPDYIQWKSEHEALREAERLHNSTVQPSSYIQLGDARLSYKHFSANRGHSKHKAH